jgi:hypothetical protein
VVQSVEHCRRNRGRDLLRPCTAGEAVAPFARRNARSTDMEMASSDIGDAPTSIDTPQTSEQGSSHFVCFEQCDSL